MRCWQKIISLTQIFLPMKLPFCWPIKKRVLSCVPSIPGPDRSFSNIAKGNRSCTDFKVPVPLLASANQSTKKKPEGYRISPLSFGFHFVWRLPVFAFTLSSAFNGLTSVFEMGTGVTHWLSSPYCALNQRILG